MLLIYSSGLTAREAVSLRKKDLDFDKMRVNIICKGKTRNTILSKKTVECLIELEKHHPFSSLRAKRGVVRQSTTNNKEYIFSSSCGKYLSVRQAQRIFDNALLKAGIFKKVSIKILRDSFAVHLLENGIAIRYIQHLLGYKSLRVAMRYEYIAKIKNVKIKSPIDYID